jgi:MoCo/4Fe-4S cofactor protein with predicted Tat translocation signal
MKIKWQHPEAPSTGKRYWRSVGELRDTPEFREWLEREFPAGASELSERESETSRRGFLQIMGAASALMGFGIAGCRRPEAKVIPFSKHVEWSIPGKAVYYATALPFGDGCLPAVVTTYDGRPTHLTGNPLHPESGGLDARATASILDMYEPTRSRQVLKDGVPSDWNAFSGDWEVLKKTWGESSGKGLGFVFGEDLSPTRQRLLGELKKTLPEVSIYRYEPLERREARVAAEAIFGEGAVILPQFAKAERVFSLDCDFLGLDRVHGRAPSDFMSGRRCEKPGDPMNRLYVLENRYSVTGGSADHRLNVPASRMADAARYLAGLLGAAEAGEVSLDADQKKWISLAAEDLKKSGAKSLVVAGSWQPAAVHALVVLINEKLGAMGQTVTVAQRAGFVSGGLEDLRGDIESGKIETLVYGSEADPVFDAPAWSEVHARVPRSIHLGTRVNATARKCHWHLPAAHVLERWSDVLSLSGVYSVVQPMIKPLFGGVSELEILLDLLGKRALVAPVVAEIVADAAATPAVAPAPKAEDPVYRAVRDTFDALTGKSDDQAWSVVLRDGFLKPGAAAEAPAINAGAAKALTDAYRPLPVSSKGSMELVFAPDPSVWDGRHIDNAWLQEMPDPITKLTWGNAAQINPHTFRELGLKEDGDLIKIELNGQSVVLPAVLAPGHARNSITLALGYGQDQTGPVGARSTGRNIYPLRGKLDTYFAVGAIVTVAGGNEKLATTAEHYSMEGRALAREGTNHSFDTDPTFAQFQGEDSHIPPNLSLYKGQIGRKSERNPEGFDYDAFHQWGMTIDLGTCTGCNACLVACQSENNIPVVGPDQVIKGREMHWIRLDRYFSIQDDDITKDYLNDDKLFAQLDNPQMIVQPVACVQCESAPCETVCPVNATVHNEEGMNLMAYNRCIGTRYCANNCPYKARRFNYFDYNKRDVLATQKLGALEYGNLYAGPFGKVSDQELSQMQKNPNVSIRMRGVMEKCTYCIQRVEDAKINQRAKAKGSAKTRIPTDGVKTACQQSCPTQAISFGDMGNPDSEVNRWKANPRNYTLLKYIGTEPRTTYLARVKNVNPAMPDAARVGQATATKH